MIPIAIKTNYIDYYFKLFELEINEKTNCLREISSLPQPRGMGKTTVLNEIGFIYQALGYEVLVWTPFDDEHTGCKLIRNYQRMRGFRSSDKTICLVDEVNLHISSHENHAIFAELRRCNVTMVGFYRS